MASISDILMAQGRQAAESRRTRAGTWTPLIQHLANLPGQVMADRKAEQDRAIALQDAEQQRRVRDLQLKTGERENAAAETAMADEAALTKLFSTPELIDQTGTLDIRKAITLAQQQSPRLVPRLMKAAQEHDEVVAKAALTAAQTASANRANQPQPPAPYTLNPGDRRFGPDNKEVASVPAEEKPDTRALNLQLADAIKRGDKAAMNAIRTAIRDEASLSRAPEKPEDPLARKERELRIAKLELDLKNAGAAGGVNEKLQAVAPVLDEITNLAGKIFTSDSGPWTNVVGAWKAAGAAANLNNDVKEYRSLVRGFTPLMARAVGHNGVLTEQDVERTELLFPQLGVLQTDNTTVANNKLERMKRIMVGGGTEQEKAEIRRAMGWETSGAGSPSPRGGGAGPVGSGGGRVRVQGPNGESGTVPAGTALPPDWKAAP